jgi:isopropylmalate/homocitrate/citramalate synthase
MKKLRAGLIKDVPLIPHIHNMLGSATMAAVGAVTGGAQGLDLVMNGVASSCGLSALEEVVVILEVQYGVKTGIKLEKLQEYSQVVARVSGVPVPSIKPIVGEHAFVVELEPFVKQVIEARERGEERVHAIAPSLVGHQNVVLWGANTIYGPATKAKLKTMGLPHDDAAVDKVLAGIKRELEAKTAYPAWLTEEEVEHLAQQLLA